MHHRPVVLALAFTLAATSASAQPSRLEYGYAAPPPPPPPSGIGGLIVGSAALGVGSLHLATLPLCFADFYPDRHKNLCIADTALFGALGLAVGIPALWIGRRRRVARRDWRQRHPALAQLEQIRLQGLGLRYAVSF